MVFIQVDTKIPVSMGPVQKTYRQTKRAKS